MKHLNELHGEMNSAEFVLPATWAGYLINGDATGYSDEEIKEIDDFCDSHELGFCTGVSDDTWFAHKNDANSLGSDVATFTFMNDQPTMHEDDIDEGKKETLKRNVFKSEFRKKLKNVKMFEEFVEDGYEIDAEDMEQMNTELDTIKLTDGRTLTVIEIGDGEWRFDVDGKDVPLEYIKDLIPMRELERIEEMVEGVKAMRFSKLSSKTKSQFKFKNKGQFRKKLNIKK
jgi:hypothetical protein